MDHFDRLIVEQIPRLRRYARALTGDVVHADDLVQDCLARAWSRRHLWLRKKRLRQWLFTIMHNLHVNALAKDARRPGEVPWSDGLTTASVGPGQDARLEARAIVEALAHLPPDQREAVLLVGLEQFSYAEAAAVLGIPLGTLMSRLHRGRERLRALTSGEGRPPLKRIK